MRPGQTASPLNGDNIIFSAKGKGKLKGGAGADEFRFDVYDKFIKRRADKIIDFNSLEGDFLTFTHCAISDFIANKPISLTTARRKKDLKLLSKGDYDFIYFKKRGRLYWDANGTGKNFGDPNEGGLIAILKGKPSLTIEDITMTTLS